MLVYTSANAFVGGAQLGVPGLKNTWNKAQTPTSHWETEAGNRLGFEDAGPSLTATWNVTTSDCAYGVMTNPSDNSTRFSVASYFPCPEDEVGFVLFKTLGLDFFVAKVVLVMVGEAKKIFKVRIS